MADKPLVAIKIHRVLAIEIYKTLNSYNPGYTKDIFIKNLRESSRHPNDLLKQGFNGITYGKNSLRHIGPEIWNNLLEYMKTAPILLVFKNLIKTWSDFKCCCRMCRAVGLVSIPNDF